MGLGDFLNNIGQGIQQAWQDVTGVTAANIAAETQQAGIQQAQQYLSPYQQAGQGAVNQLSALTGGQGADAQAQAIAAIQNSPAFQSTVQQGENAMLQQAAATGGLRGGNIQGALAQYRPQMLQNAIQQQIGNLSGIANLGVGGATGMAGYANQAGNVGAANALANYSLQSGAVSDIFGLGQQLAMAYGGF